MNLFTEDEVRAMLQATLAQQPSNPYAPDENGQFHCDPSDPTCRAAMKHAGINPDAPIVPQPPPTGPTGPIHPGNPRGTTGGPEAADTTGTDPGLLNPSEDVSGMGAASMQERLRAMMLALMRRQGLVRQRPMQNPLQTTSLRIPIGGGSSPAGGIQPL